MATTAPAINRLATSITQLTLCRVTAQEIDEATRLLEKIAQKLRGVEDIPPQRIVDLEASTCQLRQLSCIVDSCMIAASYETSQAQKALLLLPRTASGASTSSQELQAQVSPPSDADFHAAYLLQDRDALGEH